MFCSLQLNHLLVRLLVNHFLFRLNWFKCLLVRLCPWRVSFLLPGAITIVGSHAGIGGWLINGARQRRDVFFPRSLHWSLTELSSLVSVWKIIFFWMTGEAFGSTDSLVAMGASIWGKHSENLDERKMSARTARCAREIIQRQRPGWWICCWKIDCLPEGNACSSRLLNVYIVF